jgi:streptogramin lyase
MLNISRWQTLLLAATLAAGCAGPRTSSPLVPAIMRPSGFASESPLLPDGVTPDSSIGSARYYLHNTESCGHIASDEVGNVWYGICDHFGKAWLAAFDESTHTFATYRLSRRFQSPGDIVLGPNHHGIWFDDPSTKHIAYFRFADHRVTKTFYFPNSHGLYGLTAGPDNAVWFAEPLDHKIGRIDMDGFTVKAYSLPNDEPNDLVAGRDGAVWFLENGPVIGRITTAGTVSRYQISDRFSPRSLTTGPDGAIWFCGYTEDGSFVGRIDLHTHKRVIYVHKTGVAEFIATRSSELWMVDQGESEVDSFDIDDHSFVRFHLPRRPYAYGIARGADNQLYIDDTARGWITKVCPGESSSQCAKSW